MRGAAREDARVRLLSRRREWARSWRSPTCRRSTILAGSSPPRGWGANFGLTPKKYQSGETDITGRISKIGDGSVRTALYEATHVILTRPVKGSALKSWAMRLAKRAGMKKAKVALARRLAVILHRMWVDGTRFAFTAPKDPVAVTAA